MAPQESKLPSWTVVGAKGKWHSESTKAVHTVVVTSVDLVKRRVVVHFEADHKVWKTVPFAYVGGNGPLQPFEGGAKEVNKDSKEAAAANQQAGAKAAGTGDDKKDDGTATPPWYEQLNQAESRKEVRHDKKRAELEVAERQMDRQKRWQQAQKQRVEEEARRREEERRRSEEVAEKERLRILETLRVERELEQLRQREVQFMQVEDALSDRYINAPLRLAERRVQEERERQVADRLREEEAARREKESRFREEVANRPLISFGVKLRQEPVRLGHPQQPAPPQQHADQQETTAPPPEAEPLLDLDALEAAQRWADAYSAGGATPADQHAVSGSEALDAVQQEVASATAMPTVGNPYEAYQQPLQQQQQQQQQHHTVYPAVGPGYDYGYQEKVGAAEYYGSRITAIYSLHNPAKLQDVPALMAKYVGCEAEMYERVCEKYGVEPDPHLERPEPEEDVLVQQTASAKRAPAPPVKDDAPSSSDLMARFASLVTAGDETQAEQGGAVSSGSKPKRSSDQRMLSSGSKSRHGGREDTGFRDSGYRDDGSGTFRGDRDAPGYRDAGHRVPDGSRHGTWYPESRHGRYDDGGGRESFRGNGCSDQGYRDRRSRSRDRERYSDQGGYWEEGRRRERDTSRRNPEPPWRQRGGSTGRGYH